MILTAGDRRIERRIDSPQDAIEFAQAYSTDPAALFDLADATIEGDGEQWVRDALKACVYGLGNDSYDALIGLVNLIRNREWIEEGTHVYDVPRATAPVISIASGPSLGRHLETLRNLQGTCLIICADTALKGLHANGIYPHIATPVERDPELKNRIGCGLGVTYGGSLYTERAVNESFSEHLVMPSDECMGQWVDDRCIGYGSSTGVASIALGLCLSSGPVYLVGHDISFGEQSHWSGSSGPMIASDDTCIGNDGLIHRTNHWFKIFRDQITALTHSNPRIYNVNILESVGAAIPGTLPCMLPDMSDEPSFDWCVPRAEPGARRKSWPKRIAALPRDLERARDVINRSLTLEQLSAEVIMGGDNLNVALSLFRPIWIQYSIERRLGLPRDCVFLGVRNAMLNVLDHSLPILTEACHG